MKYNPVFNWIGFKFYTKMTKIESFRHLKNWSQEWTKGSKNNNGIETKFSFWNQEPNLVKSF
jgi:hypothetical protein